MTEKQVYQNVLIELRKVKSPSLHLEDYNYWGSKGIQEYCNERYLQFAMSQQLSDDLAPLTTSAVFTLPVGTTTTGDWVGSEPDVPVIIGKKYGSDFFRFKTPNDYWHMLGSHVTSVSKFNYKCYAAGYEENAPSKRLTQDIANGIINNSFLKPSIKRPYHSFGDGASSANVKPDLFYFIGDKSKFGLKEVYIDYLKEPRKINLTLQQRDLPIDTSAAMEFPEYACNEIIKRIVKLILEVSSDPRQASKPQVDLSIP